MTCDEASGACAQWGPGRQSSQRWRAIPDRESAIAGAVQAEMQPANLLGQDGATVATSHKPGRKNGRLGITVQDWWQLQFAAAMGVTSKSHVSEHLVQDLH